MIINSGDVEPRIIDDYDFLFVNGAPFNVIIDPVEGDTISFEPDKIIINIKGRPSISHAGHTTPDEELTIFKSNILIINHRRVTAIPQSPEQRNQIQELIQQKVGKSIH